MRVSPTRERTFNKWSTELCREFACFTLYIYRSWFIRHCWKGEVVRWLSKKQSKTIYELTYSINSDRLWRSSLVFESSILQKRWRHNCVQTLLSKNLDFDKRFIERANVGSLISGRKRNLQNFFLLTMVDSHLRRKKWEKIFI